MSSRRFAVLAPAVAGLSFAGLASAQTFTAVQRDDVIYGLNRNNAVETTHLVRGYPVGTRTTNEWAVNFMQSMEFDNLLGFRHNPNGNILGVNFGALATGGEVYSLQTQAGTNPGAHTKIFDFTTYNTANPGNELFISRLGGLSVSPANNRIALTGNDGGNVYVLPYAAGNGSGNGNVVTSGAKQFVGAVANGSTQGTAWLDNDNLLVTDNTGALKKIDVNTGATSTVATLTQPATASFFSAVSYEPTISPNAYVLLAGLQGGLTVNKLHVVNPTTGAVLRTIDYSTSMNTGRETAFNSRGDMLVGVFGNTTSTPVGGSIERIPDAVNFAALTDNGSLEYYVQSPTAVSAQFSGQDTANQMLDYVTNGITVDVRNMNHVQRYFGEAAPLERLRQLLQAGYNGGSWNGVGIISSTAAGTPEQDGVGYALSTQVSPAPTVDGPSFVVRYTLLGDANLSGNVNIADFALLGAKFNQAGLWNDGDFNYDGTVNIGDFSLLAANFNRSVAARPGAVPEPTTLGLLAVAATGLIRRRRA
jgi:hypothetical protein